MGEFRMDPLFEMISGKRTLSVVELQEMHKSEAQAGRAKISEVQSEVMRWVAEGERRMGGVSSGAARDFRSGFRKYPASIRGTGERDGGLLHSD